MTDVSSIVGAIIDLERSVAKSIEGVGEVLQAAIAEYGEHIAAEIEATRSPHPTHSAILLMAGDATLTPLAALEKVREVHETHNRLMDAKDKARKKAGH